MYYYITSIFPHITMCHRLMDKIISQLLCLHWHHSPCQAVLSTRQNPQAHHVSDEPGHKSAFLPCSTVFWPPMPLFNFIILVLQLRNEQNFVKSLAGTKLPYRFGKLGFSVFLVIHKACHHSLDLKLWKWALILLVLLPNLLYYSSWTTPCWVQFRVRLMLKIFPPLSVHKLFSRKLH